MDATDSILVVWWGRVVYVGCPVCHHHLCTTGAAPLAAARGGQCQVPSSDTLDISRYLDIYTTHTRKLVIKVYIS